MSSPDKSVLIKSPTKQDNPNIEKVTQDIEETMPILNTSMSKATKPHNGSSFYYEDKSTTYNEHPRSKHDKYDVARYFLDFYSGDESARTLDGTHNVSTKYHFSRIL